MTDPFFIWVPGTGLVVARVVTAIGRWRNNRANLYVLLSLIEQMYVEELNKPIDFE